jgi:hypothetical protein
MDIRNYIPNHSTDDLGATKLDLLSGSLVKRTLVIQNHLGDIDRRTNLRVDKSRDRLNDIFLL